MNNITKNNAVEVQDDSAADMASAVIASAVVATAPILIGGVAGLLSSLMDSILKDNQIEIAHIEATRANTLRKDILSGKRMRLDEMQSILQKPRYTVEQVAGEIGLPLAKVSKAVKKFWWF